MERRGFLGRLFGGAAGAAVAATVPKMPATTPGKRATFKSDGHTWQWDETRGTWITAIRLAPSHNIGAYRPLGGDFLPFSQGPMIRQVTLAEWMEMRATGKDLVW